MVPLARILLIIGIVCIVAAGVVYLAARFGLTPGRLPGDITIKSGNATIGLFIGTSIVLSILLTIILNVIARFLK
jgi:hypothetical protein